MGDCRGLRAGAAVRTVTIFLTAAWLAGSALAVNGWTLWYYQHSTQVRIMVLGLRDAARAAPNRSFFLAGVDNELFRLGMEDDPFRLFGLRQVYLVPGSEAAIHARADLGGIARWTSTPQAAMRAIKSGRGRVYELFPDALHDITPTYEAILRADPRSARIDFVDAADPFDAAQLGPTWYAAENGLRWMPKSATVRLSGPANASEKLYVTGYVPPAIVAAGRVTLTFAAGEKIGEGTITRDGAFAFEFPLPPALVGQKEIEIAIDASRVVHPATDPRDFGAAFGTFAIR